MQQIYKRTPMPKCDYNKVAYGCFPVNLLYIFRTPFPNNTSEGLRLYIPIGITEIYIQNSTYGWAIDHHVHVKFSTLQNQILIWLWKNSL